MPTPSAQVLSSVVIVGAGLAGAQTAVALRKHGFDGRVTLLGAEGLPPYDRPPLSKELLKRTEPVWLADDLGIDLTALTDDLRLADPAVRLEVDRERVVVRTASGDDVVADAVVLALGSEPVRPAGWDAAVTLHTAADAERLRAALVPGMRLVVVGAGWIGAEVAGVAAGAGARVTVVEAGPVPLERQLGRRVGDLLAPWYDAAGVTLVTGVTVDQVLPGLHDDAQDGARVTLADGRVLEADLVLAAVGARPASGWLAGSLPREASGGLRVNRAGRFMGLRSPTDPAGGLHLDALRRVWAVGDIATREHPVFGPVPGGHWSAALHDPDVTVRALLGLDERAAEPEHVRARLGLPPIPTHAPYVFSQQLGHDLALFGAPSPFDEVVLRGDPAASGGWAALYLENALDRHPRRTADGHRIVTARAVLLVDSPREVGQVRKLMNRGVPLTLDLDRALDPSIKLKDALV
ncbi:NAD(P)/FAD-dependent oxidoreductase [Promicromonospora iranensis]|uniref:NADPH-dependent 2,4-dienoyl-CoA reductase/sulfur reductase-like enzyme n=1 Tax=Promicromonospora iranensis TaxID=1105144 RepID=A0ABU2CM56_9MICO|nr:FAD-dependent oxidoreductase [Promicromonospora iranensis]MDR7382418.1 NADPH-dependent 2,4-dienoyl-CoA reductase/sulfur reductase-like enzyme [Promicromonospora iranensis]